MGILIVKVVWLMQAWQLDHLDLVLVINSIFTKMASVRLVMTLVLHAADLQIPSVSTARLMRQSMQEQELAIEIKFTIVMWPLRSARNVAHYEPLVQQVATLIDKVVRPMLAWQLHHLDHVPVINSIFMKMAYVRLVMMTVKPVADPQIPNEIHDSPTRH